MLKKKLCWIRPKAYLTQNFVPTQSTSLFFLLKEKEIGSCNGQVYKAIKLPLIYYIYMPPESRAVYKLRLELMLH